MSTTFKLKALHWKILYCLSFTVLIETPLSLENIFYSSLFVPSAAEASGGAVHPWERKAYRGAPGSSPHPSTHCFTPNCPPRQTWPSLYSLPLQVGIGGTFIIMSNLRFIFVRGWVYGRSIVANSCFEIYFIINCVSLYYNKYTVAPMCNKQTQPIHYNIA